jgi:5'-phosphate synthase pdxT subunit
MDIKVRRNAYGRQLGSFHTTGPVEGIGNDVPMTFIRAPYIEEILSDDCLPIATVDEHIVAAKQGRMIATAFHPELDNDMRFHRYFLDIAK